MTDFLPTADDTQDGADSVGSVDSHSSCESACADLMVKRPRLSVESFFSHMSRDSTITSSTMRAASASHASAMTQHSYDGIHIDELFGSVARPQPDIEEVSVPASREMPVLSSDEVLTWHPNRLFVAVVTFMFPCPAEICGTRRIKAKGFDHQRWLITTMQEPLGNISYPMDWKKRLFARDEFRRWLSKMSRLSIRQVRKISQDKWKSLDEIAKTRWYILYRLLLPGASRNKMLMSDVTTSPSNVERPPTSAATNVSSPQALAGWGYLVTYNTQIGLQDPQVMKWVQEGHRGDVLRSKLKSHTLYRACFDRFWAFQKEQAAKMGFETVCVSMEHSENAANPSRVHLHAYAGVSIRGGVGWMKSPRTCPIYCMDLAWEGCRPHLKPTITRRKSDVVIFNAVATGVYYVVGPKLGNMFKESTAWPIQESSRERVL